MDQTQPTRPDRRSPTRRRAWAVLAAGLVVVLAGCSTLAAFTDFTGVLEDAGYSDVEVTVSGTDPSILVVRASSPVGDTVAEAHDRAAELVWTRFPRRFQALDVTIDGERRRRTRAQLQEAYGARPAGLDETDLGDELSRFTLVAVVGVLLAGLLFVAAVTVVVLLIVRRRRRAAPPLGPWGAPPTPRPWMPPGGPVGPVPPPGGWTAPEPPVPTPPTPPTPAEGGRRPVGRAPRGPVPPPSQTPPGWGR